ncbi:putative ABC transporter permease protein [Austwickia chelonae NBRC 105200]|uniref:Putative ABC transporter permease protein n=2 Tax=Austwickia TaxID=1184606 RepID=K6VQF2_9MICO|nr:putative ABC transporter permease protein [Austwickia chelonae NBRC 105200]
MLGMIVCNIAALSTTDLRSAVVAGATVLIAIASLRRPRLWWGGVAVIVSGATAFLLPLHVDVPALLGLISPIGYWVACFAVSALAGIYVVLTVRPADLAALLYTVHAPRWLTVPVIVMLRFFPQARREFTAIFEAMSLRGITFGPADILRHPLRSLEYLLVPMLVSCSRIADDLTASGLVRGLGGPAVPTALRDLSLTWRDALALPVIAGVLLLGVFRVASA